MSSIQSACATEFGTVLRTDRLWGAVREHGPIPWDADLDVVVWAHDLGRLADAMASDLCADFVYFDSSDPGYDHLFPRMSPRGVDPSIIHVDVFPLVSARKSVLASRMTLATSKLVRMAYLVRNSDPGTRFAHDLKKQMLARSLRRPLRCLPQGWFRVVFSVLTRSGKSSSLVFNVAGSYGSREIMKRHHFASGEVAEFAGCVRPIPADAHGYLQKLYGDYSQRPPVEEQEREFRVYEKFYLRRLSS